jgi:hypothetical protein
VTDAGWDWEDYRQFFRLFYKDEDRAQATSASMSSTILSFYYLRISSRAQDGTIWTTWNYHSLRPKVDTAVPDQPQRPDQSFWQLYQSHKAFLRDHNGSTDLINSLDEDQSRRRSRTICAIRSRTTSRPACSCKRRGRNQVFLARHDLSLVPVSCSIWSALGTMNPQRARINTELQSMFFDTDCGGVGAQHRLPAFHRNPLAPLLAEETGSEAGRDGRDPAIPVCPDRNRLSRARAGSAIACGSMDGSTE